MPDLVISPGPAREDLCWLLGHELAALERCAILPGLELVAVACRWCGAAPPQPILTQKVFP